MGSKNTTQAMLNNVRERVDKVIAHEGYELVDVEFVPQPGRFILRLFIDTVPPGTRDRGVTVDDCTHVSRIVSDLLDAEDLVAGQYDLEVSSPGLYRPLTKPAHFDRVIGERVKVKLFEKIGDRRVFTGVLVEHAAGRLVLDLGQERVELSLDKIAKANLEPDLGF